MEAEQNYPKSIALLNAGDYAGALAACDAGLRTSPHVAALHYNRGNSLAMLQRVEESIAAYDRCLTLDPGHHFAECNRARALVQLQRWQQALEALDAIVGKYPDMADAWNNRAGVFQALGRNEEALHSIQHVLKLRPSDARALYNTGVLLLLLNRFDEAQQALAQAYTLEPNNSDILGHLASAALRACDWAMLGQIAAALPAGIWRGDLVVPPLTLLALSDDPLLQKRCAQLNLRRSLGGSAETAPAMATGVYDHPRLRIGYLSSDFRDHPVAAQIVGLLERHDRSRFEVIGFSTGQDDGSAIQHRIIKACDQFFRIGPMGAREAAMAIRNTETDILVDLNGQTLGWRPAVLQYRPAPVIATYLGYAGTIGADFVDYIIGDPHVTPFEMAPAMTEKIVQLPDSFWPGDPSPSEPEPVSRAELGLPGNAFVFCCFNANHKIRPVMFDIWMRLLRAVPGSLLWMRQGNASMNERFRRQAALRGIDPFRLHFAGRMENFARHLGRQGQADLFLDTWPYNAHATAIDALRAGLPLVTLKGQSFVSRVAAGFLVNLGLTELIAGTPEEYESIALSLAGNPSRLKYVRERLGAALYSTPLFDPEKSARNIEAAYLHMQEQRRRGEKPAAFRAGITAR